MAKFIFKVAMGDIEGSVTSEVVEIPNKELEGLTQEEREQVVERYYQEWMKKHICTSISEIPE